LQYLDILTRAGSLRIARLILLPGAAFYLTTRITTSLDRFA